MRKNNLKIQMLVGNRLNIRVGAGFEISSPLKNINLTKIFFVQIKKKIFIKTYQSQYYKTLPVMLW